MRLWPKGELLPGFFSGQRVPCVGIRIRNNRPVAPNKRRRGRKVK